MISAIVSVSIIVIMYKGMCTSHVDNGGVKMSSFVYIRKGRGVKVVSMLTKTVYVIYDLEYLMLGWQHGTMKVLNCLNSLVPDIKC